MTAGIVTMLYMTPAGKRVSWSGTVNVVPGEDIFVTARRARAKKGAKVERLIRASMVPA
jgi:hypothetical protein